MESISKRSERQGAENGFMRLGEGKGLVAVGCGGAADEFTN